MSRLVPTTIDLPTGGFHALVGGDEGARPLIFLHGFPDHPPTAIDFLAQFTDTHRVIAPWLRGYAPSTLRGPFDLERVAADILALMDKVGGLVDLVGHDWGAAIVYGVCADAPSRIRRAVTMALPHPRTLLRALRGWPQRRASWYMAFFQLPGAARLARARDFALIDRLWRAWSPSFTLDAARRRELHACLDASWPAPLAYYRALVHPLRDARQRLRRAMRRVPTPLLQLHGADDGCILPVEANDGDLFDERVRVVLPGLGHFLHVEAPDLVAARVGAWLSH